MQLRSPGSLFGGSSEGTPTMVADTMLDHSLIWPLLWLTFRLKNRVELRYSGRKRMTNVSVSGGGNGELKFPLMTSLSAS